MFGLFCFLKYIRILFFPRFPFLTDLRMRYLPSASLCLPLAQRLLPPSWRPWAALMRVNFREKEVGDTEKQNWREKKENATLEIHINIYL